MFQILLGKPPISVISIWCVRTTVLSTKQQDCLYLCSLCVRGPATSDYTEGCGAVRYLILEALAALVDEHDAQRQRRVQHAARCVIDEVAGDDHAVGGALLVLVPVGGRVLERAQLRCRIGSGPEMEAYNQGAKQ